MSVNHPHKRNCRQFIGGEYSEGGRAEYILHPKYAKEPEHYIRSFQIIQKDIHELFEYIEPAYKNISTYSYRIHALLLRCCIEVEANCKAILHENAYKRPLDNMNMSDYRKIEQSHLLSKYEVKVPNWNGDGNIRKPFSIWSSQDNNKNPDWYRAYNITKHNRHAEFEEAKFEHLIDAYCGLFVILSAQFYTFDFSPKASHLSLNEPLQDGMICGIGDYLRVKFPNEWPTELRYSFEWSKIKDQDDPFKPIVYS